MMKIPQRTLGMVGYLFFLLMLLMPIFGSNADENRTTIRKVLNEMLTERYQLTRRLMGLSGESPYRFSVYQYQVPRPAAQIMLQELEKKIQRQEQMFAALYGPDALVAELLTQPNYQLRVISEFTELVMAGALLEREWTKAFVGPSAPLSVNAEDLERYLLGKLRAAQIMLTLINEDIDKRAPERALLEQTIQQYHRLMRANMAHSPFPSNSNRTSREYPIPKDQISKWTIAPSKRHLLLRFTNLFPRDCNNILADVL